MMAMFRRRRQHDALPPDRKETGGYSSGQIMIMFALFATAMFGLLGLAVDLGMAFAERRAMQNAADLGAIAGAHAIARYTNSAPTSAQPGVASVVAGNAMSNGATIDSCNYVDSSGVSLGSCALTVPSTAIGVSVSVSEVHDTFFIRVVPGAPTTVTTSASATAEVERLYRAGMDGPFIVCGYNSMLSTSGSMDILLNNTTVNPAAIGETFQVHGPKIGTGSGLGGDCGIAASSFKGLADQDLNNGRELNEYWDGENGTRAGPTRVEVAGIEGCDDGTAAPYNCVVLLPVSSNAANGFAPIKSGSSRKFYIVKVLAFRISSCGSNCHEGTLLDDYVTFGGSVSGWTRDSGGVAVVKLKA